MKPSESSDQLKYVPAGVENKKKPGKEQVNGQADGWELARYVK
jgi:hypothetical protein